MISAQTQPPLDDLAVQLARIAEAIATAHAQDAALARAGDPTRWRRADLIWPQFAASPTKKG